MSTVRHYPSQRRVVLALVLLASAIAACDARVTGPAGIRRAPATPAAVEGDTLGCTNGWVIIAGVYVCNDT